MADLTSAIQSGLALGRAFGGNSDTYNQAYARTAQRDALLAEAQARRQKQMALESLPKTLSAAGYDPPTASVLQQAILAGVDPTKLSGYKGDIQEQGFRGNSVASALAGDWGGANANLMGVANGPVELAAIQGQNLINNRLLPGGGGVSTTDQGRAGMAADQARAAASYASANSSNAAAKAALGRLAIAQQQAALQQSGNWAPGRNFAAGGASPGGTPSPKLTEGQSKDVVYLTRGGEANKLLAAMQNNLTATGGQQGIRGVADAFLRGLPGIGTGASINALVSSERQQAEQAGQEFLSAILRKDTGAAITKEEMDQYSRMYLPQAGDSPVTIAQKAQSRKTALNAIRAGLGPVASVVPESTIAPSAGAGGQSSLSNAFGGVATQEPAAPVRRAVNPTTGKSIILVNGQWVPE